MAVLARGACHSPSNVVQEAWQLCQIYAIFSFHRAKLENGLDLWHYTLLRAQFCRLLVQQNEQIGFDQFQYITQNELREYSEKDYAERFRQIERGHQRGIDYVEGVLRRNLPQTKRLLFLQESCVVIYCFSRRIFWVMQILKNLRSPTVHFPNL